MTIADRISDRQRKALLSMVTPTAAAGQSLVRLACGDSQAVDPGDEALARITGSDIYCTVCRSRQPIR